MWSLTGRTAEQGARTNRGTGWTLTSFAAFSLSIPAVAAAAPADVFSTDSAVTVAVLAAGALAAAGGLWAIAERQQSRQLRRTLRTTGARARALVSARDAWLSAARESLLVWGADMAEPLSFGQGAEIMQACLSGADALPLSSALDELAANGAPFTLHCATSSGKRVTVRGRPAGGYLTVFFDTDVHASSEALDFRAALDVLPHPVWIRQADHTLAFVNQAFLTASGRSEEEALGGGFAFDRSERELAASAQTSGEPVVAKRFAVLSGHRRALQFTLSAFEGGRRRDRGRRHRHCRGRAEFAASHRCACRYSQSAYDGHRDLRAGPPHHLLQPCLCTPMGTVGGVAGDPPAAW